MSLQKRIERIEDRRGGTGAEGDISCLADIIEAGPGCNGGPCNDCRRSGNCLTETIEKEMAKDR